ncbi:hypothetical protein CC78DRAFT_573726 [Lojkania enalia]|uniref:Uncharacterized protein n=1 Tax=Lojkania enalia TaxID=147567 RepID=A0A9P4NC71_9PLEO|nr:hypothetical protein CC78DRAFT_573726 [Didymosphaeria enalia]
MVADVDRLGIVSRGGRNLAPAVEAGGLTATTTRRKPAKAHFASTPAKQPPLLSTTSLSTEIRPILLFTSLDARPPSSATTPSPPASSSVEHRNVCSIGCLWLTSNICFPPRSSMSLSRPQNRSGGPGTLQVPEHRNKYTDATCSVLMRGLTVAVRCGRCYVQCLSLLHAVSSSSRISISVPARDRSIPALGAELHAQLRMLLDPDGES